jgi:putative radical SAM enzyme (TIGR03279 family)
MPAGQGRPAGSPALITAVAPGSLAERAGLRVGDELVAINGHRLRDVIDVQFYSAEERVRLEGRRGEEPFAVEIERRYGEPLGLDFARPLFDGIRRCNNHCGFCFVAQLPPGLRPSLYVKDDDYRLSFLHGSYVTLTNLNESDWARIAEQHLSPLYVSVHATDVALRRRLLGNPGAPDVLAQLRRLAGLGIEVHTQIVVIPGINGGPVLDRSIGDLAELYPAVRSVSVVPVGVTRFHRGTCRAHTGAEMRVVFEQVTGWQARLRKRLGVNFSYLSDEWYLRLGEPVPELDAYDGLDLTENGVGMVSRFGIVDSRLQSAIYNLESATLVTGTLFAPILRKVFPEADVVPVVNRAFGETVTVAGLLTGRDVIRELRGRELGDVVVLPAAMFGGPEGQTLDGMVLQQIGAALKHPVMVEDAFPTQRGVP